MNRIRVRFAPSPTGFLHVGGLRTALYNYLFAKHVGGIFILRIEDTDQKRFVEGALESLIKSLKWAGIEYDEGVFFEDNKIVQKGDYGPYVQSERLELYKKYAEQLVKDGKAYYCFCKPERLSEMRKTQEAQKQPPMYDQYCLKNLSQEQIEKNLKNNVPCTIRLKIPENEVVEFTDMIRGKVSISTNTIDDTVLLKSDGFPTYHLANVVDDHLMQISHVIRGEEWVPSTPKHILLYKAFGWEIPQFAHLPLLLNPDKTKLSKRQGDVSVEDYVQKGYLKEAIINFVALLGWNPGKGSTQEIFSLEELVKNFELEKVHKAGAVFDLKKLNWINGQYIKKMSTEELYEKAFPFLKEKDFYKSWNMDHGTWNDEERKKYIEKVLTIEKERLENLSQIGESNRYFFEEIEYDKKLLEWKKMDNDQLKKSLNFSKEILDNISKDEWQLKTLEEKLVNAPAAYEGAGRGELLWPLRVALTGKEKSPSPFEIAWVLGKEESLKRIEKAIDKI
jgi:glutamyl-tRNA synthetase